MSARGWVARWWAGEAGLPGRVADAALAPAELLFRAGVSARNVAYDRGWISTERVSVPVVSVGNVGVGGAGKTPVAAFLAGRLRGMGRLPAVALRGYGADEVQVHRELNPDVPVFAAARRVEAARAAAAAGRDVVVLDDGFQHRALARDLDLVLVSAEGWTERRRLLPRGPWRESAAALRRAGLVMVTRKSASPREASRVVARVRAVVRTDVVECWIAPGELVPIRPGDEGAAPPTGGAVLAVAALADPAPFADHLRERGLDVELAAFPDHHEFDQGETAGLLARAGNRPILMTHKDAVKLRLLLPPGAPAWMLTQTVRVTGGADLLERALAGALGRRGA